MLNRALDDDGNRTKFKKLTSTEKKKNDVSKYRGGREVNTHHLEEWKEKGWGRCWESGRVPQERGQVHVAHFYTADFLKERALLL